MVVPLPIGVSPGTTVQLLTARGSDADQVDDACFRLLFGGEPGRRNVVAITIDRSAEAFVDAWLGHAGENRADVNVVDVGTGMRSVAAGRAAPTPSPNVIQSIGDARDLASIRARVEALVIEPVPPGERRFVYLDSATGLFEQAGLRAGLDFVAALRDLTRRTGAIAFVRADRQAHSRYTFDVLSSLVDVTLAHSLEEAVEAWSVPSGRTAIAEAEAEAGATAPRVDDRYGLLSARTRRLALHFLHAADGSMAMADLARVIADADPSGADGDPDTAFRRIYTGLVHVHLPVLEDHGVVSVDAGDEIRLEEAAGRLEPLLALTARGDLLG